MFTCLGVYVLVSAVRDVFFVMINDAVHGVYISILKTWHFEFVGQDPKLGRNLVSFIVSCLSKVSMG